MIAKKSRLLFEKRFKYFKLRFGLLSGKSFGNTSLPKLKSSYDAIVIGGGSAGISFSLVKE
jgi:hypothetical protein